MFNTRISSKGLIGRELEDGVWIYCEWRRQDLFHIFIAPILSKCCGEIKPQTYVEDEDIIYEWKKKVRGPLKFVWIRDFLVDYIKTKTEKVVIRDEDFWEDFFSHTMTK